MYFSAGLKKNGIKIVAVSSIHSFSLKTISQVPFAFSWLISNQFLCETALTDYPSNFSQVVKTGQH